jgi:hypothetical protein
MLEKIPILLFFLSFQYVKAQEIDVHTLMQQDTQAIRLVLEAETTDFLKMPLAELTQKYWLLDSMTLMAVSLLDGSKKVFDQQSFAKASTKIPSQNIYKEYHKSNYNIYWHGESAFVTNEQYFIRQDGTKVYSHEMRVMRKVDGLWKIHLSSVHQFTPPGYKQP